METRGRKSATLEELRTIPRKRSDFKATCRCNGLEFGDFKEIFDGDFYYRKDGYTEKKYTYIYK